MSSQYSLQTARKVLWSATGIMMVSGFLYIWGIVNKALVDQLGWTSKQASLPYTLATVSFVIAMVFFGRYQDVHGPRRTATIGALLMGGGIFCSGFLMEPHILMVTMGVIAGCGIGVLNVSTTPPAVKWFPAEKKGMITGIVVGGVSVSSLVFAPLANYLSSAYGIDKVFFVIGGIMLLVSVTLAQNLSNPISVPSTQGISQDDRGQLRTDFHWYEMLRTKHFYILWGMLGLSASAGLMVIGHISTIAVIQAQWRNGFLLVMLLSVFNTVGRFLGGTLSDQIGRINLMRLIFVLQCVNMFLFARYTSAPALAFGVALAGFCYGATFSVFPAAISDYYGLKDFGTNFGLMFTGWGMGGIIGPMTGAYIYDLSGQYSTAYLVASLLLFVALVLTFVLAALKKPLPESVRRK